MKVRVVFLRDASPYAAGEAAGFDRTEAQRLKNSGIVEIPGDEDAASTDTADTDVGANGGGPGGAGGEDAGGGDGTGSGNDGTSADSGQSQPDGSDTGSSGTSDGTGEGGSTTSTDGTHGGGEPNGAGGDGSGENSGSTVTQVEIPDNWRAAHHATKKKLAREIGGEDPADVAAAEAVIEAEIARRAALGAQA